MAVCRAAGIPWRSWRPATPCFRKNQARGPNTRSTPRSPGETSCRADARPDRNASHGSLTVKKRSVQHITLAGRGRPAGRRQRLDGQEVYDDAVFGL